MPSRLAFTSRDPLDGVPGTAVETNPFHYADNDPLNKTDPTGLRPDDGVYKDPCGPFRAQAPTAVMNADGVCEVDLNLPGEPPDYPDGPVSDSWHDPWNADYCKDSWRHPTRTQPCAEAMALAMWAQRTAIFQFNVDRDSNAYRHCLWAGILVWGLGEYGDNGARGFLNRHEGTQLIAENGYLTDSGIDRQNNEVGYSTGRTLTGLQGYAKNGCKSGCLTAFYDGRLRR